ISARGAERNARTDNRCCFPRPGQANRGFVRATRVKPRRKIAAWRRDHARVAWRRAHSRAGSEGDMRYSLGSLVAAAIAFGLPIAGSTAENAESVMRTCAAEWKQAQAAGTTGSQTWPQFLAQCRTKPGSAAAAPTPAPAAQS